MPLALLPFTKAKILNKKLVFWPDKLIKVSVSESAEKPGVRGRRSGSLGRTAGKIKRLKETVLTISPDYSDRPTPDFLALSWR
jgi:hypothetical protein